jgi:hypothetical protein
VTTKAFVKLLQYFSRYKFAGPCLLVLVGVAPHQHHTKVEAVDRHDVTLFYLPSQTAHEMHLMDQSVFGPCVPYWYKHFLLFYINSTVCTLNKHSFGNTFIEAWDKAATSANITARFRAIGICLFKNLYCS